MAKESPVAADPAAPFWAAVAEERLDLPVCEDCGTAHLYPRSRCPACGGARLAWRGASGRGEIYSFSVVHRAPTPAFAAEVPYTVAIVRLAEGPHLMGRLNAAPEAARIGQPVRIRFGESAGGRIAIFEPEAQS
ncbi:MAG TPA: Zn-ribbon domain-containing OB-fold protein [Acetobacteraceae bacterium]|nr:Zn-ribbon domain-containing OB-fold protein [Acetobacteraceae bacterium]